MDYVGSAERSEGCVLCAELERAGDPAASVLRVTGSVFTLLNAFPYNTGHLMVAPCRHVGDVADLDPAERHELIDETGFAVAALREAFSPEGFNVGMNVGSVAGAGIPGHVHVHVVPRWGGDTNFMPVIGQTKVLPEMLEQTRARLVPLFGS